MFEPLARGVPASPGVAKGAIVFAAERAVEQAAAGERVILVRAFTEAADVAGFNAARGILTSEGGKASHAALVARGMGRPCVCGVSALDIDLEAREMRVGGTVLKEGDLIAIDGSTGAITVEDVPLVPVEVDEHFQAVLDGRTSSAGSGCVPTPTDRRTPRLRGASAPRAWASAAPSTCFSATTARRRCRR